jgi:hypothetical protein
MRLRTFIVLGILVCCLPAFAEDQREVLGFNPVLNKALGGEEGVQVYMDREGNVGTVIDAGSGHRSFSVQPPQSQSMNLGPPLQLQNKFLALPRNASPTLPDGKSSPSAAR